MRTTLFASGTLLLFALGCADLTGGAEPPAPPAPVPAAVEPAPAPVPVTTDAPEAGGDCCCEYTEEGQTTKAYASMARTNCTSWGFACVEDAKCSGTAPAPAPAPAPATAPAPAPAPAPTTSAPKPAPAPIVGPTVMTRDGKPSSSGTSGTSGTMTRGGSSTSPSPSPSPAPSGTMTRPR